MTSSFYYDIWVSTPIRSSSSVEGNPDCWWHKWAVEATREDAEAMVTKLLKAWKRVKVERVLKEEIINATSDEPLASNSMQDLPTYTYSYKDYPVK